DCGRIAGIILLLLEISLAAIACYNSSIKCTEFS
ncbi:MAG: hypothetical protein ACI8YB_002149, partial [Patiriisocius sp.]